MFLIRLSHAIPSLGATRMMLLAGGDAAWLKGVDDSAIYLVTSLNLGADVIYALMFANLSP